MGHQPPGYAPAQHVHNTVYHLPQIHGAWETLGRIRRQQGLQQAPPQVGQICGICLSFHTPKIATIQTSHQAISFQVYAFVGSIPVGGRIVR